MLGCDTSDCVSRCDSSHLGLCNLIGPASLDNAGATFTSDLSPMDWAYIATPVEVIRGRSSVSAILRHIYTPILDNQPNLWLVSIWLADQRLDTYTDTLRAVNAPRAGRNKQLPVAPTNVETREYRWRRSARWHAQLFNKLTG
ncbi:hypothetical protein J6590_050844 [Homalodisca vitripennis]|nr:hypothetical protein J6590_050844 [Homalodisca vitripennis]